MQFNFDCEEILDCNQNGYSILEGACHNNIPPGYKAYIKEILDKMGELSSKSQNLLVNVTTTNRFFPSDHTLIIKADKNKVLGYIKVGPKRLFLRDRICNYHERKTLCVLDFYIYDTEQRKGLGKEIFFFFLNYKKINPVELAYDRPTLRFLAFLKRNYGLENYIQQENNFTIYDEFFESERNKNNETQYDSDTHRVIQNLYTPRYLNRSVDFNSNNKYITNINPNYNNNNYRNSPQNNQRNMNIKKNYYLTETDNYQRTSMSPIGKQLIYNNDMIDNKRNNYQKYYNYNQRMNQYNERNNDIRYNITNRYNEDNQNQIYNKRYNNEDFNYDNRNQEYDYNQQNNNNQRLQNTINKGRFSPNQMSKSMQAYENNYNNNQNNYGGRRRLKYDYDDY